MTPTRALADVARHGVDDEPSGPGRPALAPVVIELDGAPDELLEQAADRLADTRDRLFVGVGDTPVPDTPAGRRLVETLDVVLAPDAPLGAAAGDRADLESIVRHVAGAPVAAHLLGRVLRTTAELTVPDGLLVESLAYSSLLAGAEFAAWLDRRDPPSPSRGEHRIRVKRDGVRLEITLDRPHRRNAFDARLRDELVEALAVAGADPSIEEVLVRGDGPAFCSGGDLAEFGTSDDLAAAALLRVDHGVALPLHHLAGRVRCLLHGACVGAGIEVPSFAGHVAARADTWIQLPELSMGLIPGAGGTIGIPRRIGRWRTAFLALSGEPIDRATAHVWGLVDECV